MTPTGYGECKTHNTRFLPGGQCFMCRNERVRAEAKAEAARWAAARDAATAAPRQSAGEPGRMAGLRAGWLRRRRWTLAALLFWCAWALAIMHRGG